jgi:L-ascorbate metabolism protein UlaG (beta-lactamase superfamily)
MKAKYYGHSCIELEINGLKVLFDPFITPNELAKHIEIKSVTPDFILVSHTHGDHVADLFTVQKSKNAKVICIADIEGWLNENEVNHVHPMNIGGSYNFEVGRVKMVYALHSSSTPDGKYGGNPAGFVIYADDKKIYFAGDTALTMDMQLLADENLDLAFLPIGDNYTMGPDDAIKAAKMIKCNNIVGIHYDTFPYIRIQKEEALEKFAAAGLNLHLPAIGESFEI